MRGGHYSPGAAGFALPPLARAHTHTCAHVTRTDPTRFTRFFFRVEPSNFFETRCRAFNRRRPLPTKVYGKVVLRFVGVNRSRQTFRECREISTIGLEEEEADVLVAAH